MDLLHEFKVCNGISTKCWSKIESIFLEASQMLSQVYVRDVVDDVEQCNARTSIAYSLEQFQ